MNHTKGFASVTILAIVFGLIVLGGIGYMNKDRLLPPVSVDEKQNTNVAANQKESVVWQFANAGEVEATPYTNVSVSVKGATYKVGKFAGSCAEVGATGGVDGKGLLAGELSAAQCWFAGGGSEVGVFAKEDGGYEIMVGDLSEGEDGSPMFRGDFKIKVSI